MNINTINLLNLDKTIAKNLFLSKPQPWTALPDISSFILSIGQSLSPDVFDMLSDNIWVAKNAKISPTASLNGPLIIDEFAEIRHCAFIRGSVIVGKSAVVGNSTELKNSILFDSVQVPHYNYIGDSILGYKVHFGAGSITSNVKSDKSFITISLGLQKIQTNLRKFGAIVGDYVEIGCNAVLNPGTIIGRNSNIYPLVSVRGVINPNCICKSNSVIVEKNI